MGRHWVRLQTVKVCLLENGEFSFPSCLLGSRTYPDWVSGILGTQGQTMAHLRYFLQEESGRGARADAVSQNGLWCSFMSPGEKKAV